MKIQTGLRTKLFRDPRNLSRSKRFGAPVNTALIPANFDLYPDAEVLDQVGSTCTAFACKVASDRQEGIKQSPEYAFYKTRVLEGGNPHKWGADINDALRAWCKYGGIATEDSPYNFHEHGQEYIEDPKNWSEYSHLDAKAAEHKKKAYMDADGYSSMYNSIRATMWESFQKYDITKNPSDLRLVIVGLYWQPGWELHKDGVLDIGSLDKSMPHLLVARGCAEKLGSSRIILHNSFGKFYGDNGLFYASESVINKYAFEAKVFEDIDPEELKKLQWSFIAILYNYIKLLQTYLKTVVR